MVFLLILIIHHHRPLFPHSQPTQWYFALHCVRVCRTCFHKRGGPVELCTLSFACDETGLDEDQLSGLCRISLCHGRGLSLPEVEADKPCMLVMRRSACKVAASIRRQSSKVKPVPMVFEEEDEVEEEQPAPVMLQPSPRGAHGARKRRPLSHLRPASWPGHNNAKSTGAITAAKGLELLRDMLGYEVGPMWKIGRGLSCNLQLFHQQYHDNTTCTSAQIDPPCGASNHHRPTRGRDHGLG